MNAQLMSENSKIPYVATAVWRSKDGKPRREGLDLTSLTEQQKEEGRRNTDSIVRKWTAVHGDRMYKEKRIEEEEIMKRAEEALKNSGIEEKFDPGMKRDEEIKSEAPESMDTAPPPENEDDMKDMKEEDSNRGPWEW